MDMKKSMAVLAVVIVAVAAFAAATDDSDAASSYSARVFIGDGTDHGTKELSGSGDTLRAVLTDALSDRLVLDANGTVKSLDGVENTNAYYWMIYQWNPPSGWTSRVANSTGNAYLEDGTSYYVYYAEATTVSGKTTYSTPEFEPEATAYFFIQFKEDVNANDYVTSVLTEEQRSEGFWISGTGSTAAWAFMDACEKYGFELVMNDGSGTTESADLVGWLGSFLGLEDVGYGDGSYKYWSQYSWDDDTGSWIYNDNVLGYYDPGVTTYYALVRQITLLSDVEGDSSSPSSTLPTQTPSDAPISSIENSCTVTFVDGDGNVIKTENVEYFGSATAPSTATKTSSGGYSYTFVGWDEEFDQVISDLTVTAVFEAEAIAVTGVSLSSSSLTLGVGESSTLSAAVSPSNAYNSRVTWSSSDSSVAAVSSSGGVTAVGVGTATITVTTNDGGYTATCVVTVSEEKTQVSVESVSLDRTALTLEVGGTGTLTATVSPSDATDASVTWSSSDTSVATVLNGAVTAVGVGTATITVTTNDGGYTATCEVTVEAASSSGSDDSDDGGDSTLVYVAIAIVVIVVVALVVAVALKRRV